MGVRDLGTHAHRCAGCRRFWSHENQPGNATEDEAAFVAAHTCPFCGRFAGWSVKQTSVDGLDIALKDKDKAWAEAQKRELISNAWELEKRAQGTVKHAAVALVLGLAFVGGAVVYNGRRR